MGKIQEIIKPGEATLTQAWGKHPVTGHLGYVDAENGRLLHWLGEGVWNRVLKAEYEGYELSVLDDAQVRFRPGTPEQSAITDWFPDALAYSGTVVLAVDLPADAPDASEQPGKLKAVCETGLVPDYNERGTYLGESYSANPARVFADGFRKRGLTRLIDFKSWVAWRDACDVALTWSFNGNTYTTPRFEANVFFSSAGSVRQFVELIALVSCTVIQFTGLKYRFFPPTVARTASYTFSFPKNVVSYKVYTTDAREKPVYLRASFRDAQNDYLEESSWIWIHPRMLESADVVDTPPEIRFSTMSRSQVSRVLNYQGRLKADCDRWIDIQATPDSFPVLVGDVVRAVIPDEGIDGLFLVVRAGDDSPERTADTRSFTLQTYDPAIYTDEFVQPNAGQTTRPAPINLSAGIGGYSITLQWTRNSTTNTAVEVYLSGALVTTLPADTFIHTFTAPAVGSYPFRVRNLYDTGPSQFSNEAVAVVVGNTPEPGYGGGTGGGGGGPRGGFDGYEWEGMLQL